MLISEQFFYSLLLSELKKSLSAFSKQQSNFKNAILIKLIYKSEFNKGFHFLLL